MVIYDADEDMLWLLVLEWMNNTESDDIKLLLKFLFSEKRKASKSEREYSNQTSISFDHFGSVIVNDTYIISDIPADFSL